MKQIKIVDIYNATEDLSKANGLSINAKWVLFRLRKDLKVHYDFYVEESRKLLNKCDGKIDGTSILFASEENAKEYQVKQSEIDNLDVKYKVEKQSLKLSEVPSITVAQMETLGEFIEFVPE